MKTNLFKNKTQLNILQELKRKHENDIEFINLRLKNRHLIIKIGMFVFFPLRLLDFSRVKKVFIKRKLNKTKKSILKLQKLQLIEIKKYLYDNNLRFNELVKENYKLLHSSDFKIRTYKRGGSIGSSYSKKLRGKILNNGFMYLKTVKKNIAFLSFQNGLYPRELRGTIDYLGNAELETVSTNWVFLGGRTPNQFTGTIIDGKFVAYLDDAEWEPLGTLNMDKLFCDPFKNDEKKRKLFLSNRFELLFIIEKSKTEFL